MTTLADKGSNSTQILQSTLDVTNQAVRVNIAAGSVAASTGFTHNGSATAVIEDTVTAANNLPLPVTIYLGPGLATATDTTAGAIKVVSVGGVSGTSGPVTLLNGVAMSADQTSALFATLSYTMAAIQFSWTGLNNSTDVTFKVQSSNDNVTWTDISDLTYLTTAAAGNGVFRFWPLPEVNIRVVALHGTSTTGTLTAKINAK